jgi:hypothetical protein
LVALTIALLGLAAGPSAAQGTTGAEPRAWSGSASLFGYFVPADQDYAQPTFAADRGRLHLEARYNYESLATGSAWVGVTFSAGSKLRMDLTPMLGGVFGDLHGLAPGYELTLAWSILELDSESEYFLDPGDSSGDFFYTWSELAIAPSDRWRAGIAAQRTRAYETGLDVQRGLLAGASFGRVDVTAYVFNLGWEDPTVVLSAEVGF